MPHAETAAGRARTRAAARRARSLDDPFRTLAENSPDLIARLDTDRRHVYVNRVCESVFGMPAARILGRRLGDLTLPSRVKSAWGTAVKDALRSGERQTFAFTMETPPTDDGRTRHYSGRAIPESGRSGRTESVLVVVYDITQQAEKKRERERLLAREQAAREQGEAAARARDQFLAIVSHELRSPLNGIQSWAHVLDHELRGRTPVMERALAGIRTGIEQQVRLIEDLLDATRIVSGTLRLSKQPFQLRTVLEAALESVQAAAAAKQVRIHRTIHLASEQMCGDPDRIQQVFWNLLDNAVKFVASGGNVWVEAARDGATLAVKVRDDGRGIAPDFLPHLFDRFRQADISSTRRHDGLGLGLALVHHLTQMHGGSVRAESPGKGDGATFHVEFPAWHAAGTGPTTDVTPLDPELPRLDGLRVLVVDDQQETRESIAALLSNAGAQVAVADSGRAALSHLDASAVAARPEVVLCDIAMPEEDGYQTLKRIRAWENATRTGRAIPAIALTAFSLREDRIRALAAGYEMHLTKPVAPAELIVVMAMVSGRMGTTATT